MALRCGDSARFVLSWFRCLLDARGPSAPIAWGPEMILHVCIPFCPPNICWQMLGARLQHVFDPVQLWADTEPDTLQLTKIGCAQKLANHWDRRDRWQEGIASLAWSELPSEGAPTQLLLHCYRQPITVHGGMRICSQHLLQFGH